ncbi:histidine kinase [Streptomyces sp. NPDC003077]|uniref:sensor histidine kinase n=1 Tax=Streptomyces sp. NPDC003077 TaxID=3154443 RepID=UPI0033A687C8
MDLGIALIVQAAVTIPFVVPRPPGQPPATLLFYLAATLTVLPLLWRRRAPVIVMGAVLAAQSLYFFLDGPGQPLPYTGLVALYTVAAQCSARARHLVGVLMGVVVAVSVALHTGEARELLFSLFVFGAAYAFGRLTHTRQAYTRAMEDRAAQLERANRIEAQQAAARERARIAREMHDILSHAVSLMVVQAEAGPVAVRAAPERAEAAFDAISETGRDAMTQLRHMLGVLRDEDAPDAASGDGGAAGAGAARHPQPALADLPGLIERVARGGPAVRFETAGTVRPLSPGVEATAYRVVQEALTNVVKHADARTAHVLLTYSDEALHISVTDDGRGPGPVTEDGRGPGPVTDDGRGPSRATGGRRESSGTTTGGRRESSTAPRLGTRTGGQGLIGIRERAAAHGGTARTGPGPDGTGFEVEVRLPCAPSARESGGTPRLVTRADGDRAPHRPPAPSSPSDPTPGRAPVRSAPEVAR